MLGIARLADRGPMTAASLAALLLVGAILIPAVMPAASILSMPFIIGSAAVVAFVILKRGESAALRGAGLCVALLILLSLLLYGSAVQMPLIAMVFWLPAVLAAIVLRRLVSLDLAVLAITGCGVLTAIGVHLLSGADGGLWKEPLAEQLGRQLGGAEGLDEAQLTALVEGLANMMTGAMGVSVMSVALASLFVGRYWQAAMVRPGGFREEFHALSLGRNAALVCLAVVALSVGVEGRLWDALAIVAVFAFFVQGLAVAHALVRERGLAKGWLVGLYVFLLLPHTLLLVAALGLADNLFALRGRGGAAGGGTSA